MNPWSKLPARERGAYIRAGVRNGLRSLDAIERAYGEYASGGDLDATGKRRMTDEEYRKKIREIAAANARKWGMSAEDAYRYMMRQREYDYRSYYNDNTKDYSPTADREMPERYKTYWNPTFTRESKYSGVKNGKYNPQGAVGGHWENGEYIPADEYHARLQEELKKREASANHAYSYGSGGHLSGAVLTENKADEEKTDAIQNGVDLREYDEKYQPREMVGNLAIALQSPHEEGLRIVSPEFDLLTLGRSIYGMPRYVGFGNAAKESSALFHNPNSYYRQGIGIIDDAKKSGVVRTAAMPHNINGQTVYIKDFANPMFSKGTPWYRSTGWDVIEAKRGTKGLGWNFAYSNAEKAPVDKAGRRIFSYQGQHAEAPSNLFDYYKAYGPEKFHLYFDVTNGGMTLPVTGIDFLRSSTSKKSKGGRLAHKFDGTLEPTQWLDLFKRPFRNVKYTITNAFNPDVWKAKREYNKLAGKVRREGERTYKEAEAIMENDRKKAEAKKEATHKYIENHTPKSLTRKWLADKQKKGELSDIEKKYIQASDKQSKEAYYINPDGQPFRLQDNALAMVYPSMIDSIGSHFANAGISETIAAGLPYRETTWANPAQWWKDGVQILNNGSHLINPFYMINYEDPYMRAVRYASENHNSKRDSRSYEQMLIDGFGYADSQARQEYGGEGEDHNILAQAARFYMNGTYNATPGYKDKVRTEGQMLLNTNPDFKVLMDANYGIFPYMKGTKKTINR